MLNLQGGGGGPSFIVGNSGGAGGTLNITGGTTTLSGASLVNLQGGSSSSGVGSAGGAGGAVNLSAGTFAMTSGKILLAGGAGGIPGDAGHVDLTGGTFNLTAGLITGDASLGSPATGSVLARSTLNVSGGTFNSNASPQLVLVDATVNLSGGVMSSASITRNTSAFNFTGGMLHVQNFFGDLANGGGTLAPGNSPGITMISGNYTQNSGTLAIELGGISTGLYDILFVTGTATLGGTLDVSLINGFVPPAGSSFDILNWGTLSGTFANVNLPNLGGGLTWNTSQLYTNGTLTVGGLVGDYNHNGTVDAADYVVWRDTLGQTGAGLAADGNFNNIIDAGDLTAWRAHFGQTAGSGAEVVANVAVPEPTNLVLLIIGLLAIGSSRCVALRRYQVAVDKNLLLSE